MKVLAFHPGSWPSVTYHVDLPAVLKESWNGEVDLPLDLGKNVTEFMRDLQDKLQVAHEYAKSHCDRAQERYTAHYNLRSKDKHFTVGEQVLILSPDSTDS